MKYRSIKKAGESKFTVKGSKFLGFALPADNVNEIEEQLETLRKRYYDATHHCYAWKLGFGNHTQFRYSDDGEPTGSAGKPIYHAILHRELTNILVVSVRYFGGTKLGTGGLARAYGQSASEALDSATIFTVEKGDKIRFDCSYEEHAMILHIANQYPLITLEQEFGETVLLTVEIPEEHSSVFLREVKDACKGKLPGQIVEKV